MPFSWALLARSPLAAVGTDTVSASSASPRLEAREPPSSVFRVLPLGLLVYTRKMPSRERDERGSVWRSKEVEVEGNPVLSRS